MSLPNRNARILSIKGRATREDFDEESSQGPPRFEATPAGSASGAWYTEKSRRRVENGTLSIVVERQLVVSRPVVELELREGDVVEFERLDVGTPATITATISDVEGPTTGPGRSPTATLIFAPA